MRPARSADWEKIMEPRNVILCGDWNAHSKQWNDRCTQRRNATFLETLIQKYELQVMNDDEDICYTMRGGNVIWSIIDVTLAKGDVGNDFMVETLSEDDDAMLSDHMMIQLCWGRNSQEGGTSSRITGWNIDKMEEKDLKEAKEMWGKLMEG